jgi:hypothetical protein
VRSALVATVLEARNVVSALREEQRVPRLGPVVVSGVLAEQLAKELSAGARPGAVIVGEDPRGVRAGSFETSQRSQVAVRIIAGDPSEEDDAFVRAAEKSEIPIVVVQLWPQENWRAPFVLSPFVVECKTGEGFPLAKIAGMIATAADDPTALASRIPVLKQTVERLVKRDAIIRSALLATSGKKAARPALMLEQIGVVSRLRTLEDAEPRGEEQMPIVAGTAAAAIAASYGLRELARRARRVLPDPVADAAVAAAGTWAVAEASRRLLERFGEVA